MLLLKSDRLTHFLFFKEASKKKGAVLVKRTMARTTCHIWESTEACSRQRLGRSGFLSRRHFQDEWEPSPPDAQAPERWVKKLSYHPQTGSLQACNTHRKRERQSVPASGASLSLKGFTLRHMAIPSSANSTSAKPPLPGSESQYTWVSGAPNAGAGRRA